MPGHLRGKRVIKHGTPEELASAHPAVAYIILSIQLCPVCRHPCPNLCPCSRQECNLLFGSPLSHHQQQARNPPKRSSSPTSLFCLLVHYSVWFGFYFLWCSSSITQSCLTLCDPVDCSPPGSSIHGILQARILEWAVMPSSRVSYPQRLNSRLWRLLNW